MKILVIGFNTRHIVCSARRAGHTVYSLSHYNDVDLKACSNKSITWDETDIHNLDFAKLIPLIKDLLPVEAVVLGPGCEHLGQWIEELMDGNGVVLNNAPDVMTTVSDKIWLAEKLNSLKIPHPHTVPLKSISTPDDWGKGYPAILKPIYGAGGVNTIPIHNSEELGRVLNHMGNDTDQYLLQEYVNGMVVSVSLLSTRNNAVAVAVNEQLVGVRWLTEMPFAYCGNITPYISEDALWLRKTAINLAVKLKLVGTNGVDFIITDHGPIVLEVNPRFQGSIDTVEKSTGINIFQSHCDSFNGLLPEYTGYQCYCNKSILFAPDNFIIGRKKFKYFLQCFRHERVADIPPEGTICEKDEPVASFISKGADRNTVVQYAKYLVGGLVNTLE